jgi:hypothetical protein
MESGKILPEVYKVRPFCRCAKCNEERGTRITGTSLSDAMKGVIEDAPLLREMERAAKDYAEIPEYLRPVVTVGVDTPPRKTIRLTYEQVDALAEFYANAAHVGSVHTARAALAAIGIESEYDK